jgi:hypothetical protein
MARSNLVEMKFSERNTGGFEVVDASFGKDTDRDIEKWLHEKLSNLIDSHRDLHTGKIPKWRKLYFGNAPGTANFPFPGASRVIVQLIGDRVDTLTARVLGYLFSTSPLWHFAYPAVTESPRDAERKRECLSTFMDTVGFEPSELDLYRVYGQWFTDGCRLGTAFVKATVEDCVEAVSTGYTSSRQRDFDVRSIYNGPRVHKLRHEDVLMDAGAQTPEMSRLVAIRRPLTKFELQERVFDGLYDKKAVEEILEKPDRMGPDANESKEQRKKGVSPIQSEVNATWDIYESYFKWFHGGKKYSLIYSYHFSSRKVLRRIFNFIPDNSLPLVRTKLGYRNDGAYGHGFAELLELYQEEATDIHRNRVNNMTLANTRFWRISPSAVNIGTQVEIFPSAAITANKDEVEAMQMADVYQSSPDAERITMELADARAGIAPAVTGSGAGGPTKGKGNPYSSLGTLAAMQEGNHRTNLATSDFRHAHQKLGSLLTSLYGKFGTGGKEEMFGADAHYLKEALEEFLKQKCRIPIRSTAASINKEVEKQNDMLMVGLIQRHYTAQAQIMQAVNNPMIPDNAKKYLMHVLAASDRLMNQILRDFGKDQPKNFIPDAEDILSGKGEPSATKAQRPDPSIIQSAAIAARPVGEPPLPSGSAEGLVPQPGMGAPQGRP